jgi:FAD/FMN-containing dehydrogenase
VIKRRQVLEGIAATAAAARSNLYPKESYASPALPSLPRLNEDEALLLIPGDSQYERCEIAYNRRTLQRPALRALCKTATAVSAMVEWVREHNLSFALRSGGHSFEGFSQSSSVVIDTRMMNDVEFDDRSRVVAIGAGASRGSIYQALASAAQTIPAGTCPTVAISGHALGGGFGLLARAMGLSCDNLAAIELVDTDAHIRQINFETVPDLMWACQGGGGGSFGAVTRLHLRTHSIARVAVFGLSWRLPAVRAGALMRVWQAWAPHAPSAVTGFFRISKAVDKTFNLRCAGQSTGSQVELLRELRPLMDVESPDEISVESMSLMGAVNHFSGGWGYESSYSKGKSAFISSPLSETAVSDLFEALAQTLPGTPTIVCDAYGGAIADVAPSDTAFVHRAGTLYCMQFHASWPNAAASQSRIDQVDLVYNALQPYLSGGAYVNYCDLDLADWPKAYWGSNLARLRKIKAEFDPANLFQHAQSVR